MNSPSAVFRGLARLLVLTLLNASAAAQGNLILPDLGDPAQEALPPSLERRIGEAAWHEFRADERTYVRDAEIEEYVNTLGRKLVASTALRDQPFRFFVLRDDTINAFAMPGGYIGLHTGLIRATQSESELASVLAHEIGHIEQRHMARMLAGQSKATAAMLAGMLVAVLAARSNSQISEAALASGQAYAIDQQLRYSRDFEREADRVGFQTLNTAGFDPQAMPRFFERLGRVNSLSDFNAPAYLRTHPLSIDRMSDMEGRAQQAPRRIVADSLEFALVRAKIDAERGTPAEALARVEAARASSDQGELARLYGLTRVRMRAKQVAQAEASLKQLRALGRQSAMIEGLAADVARAAGQAQEAARICHEAQQHFTDARFLLLCEAEALLEARQPERMLALVESRLALDRSDIELFTLQARAHAQQGNLFGQQRAQAEVYALQGSLGAAIEQLRLAQLGGGGNYFEQAAVDARLRELRQRLRDERPDGRVGDDRARLRDVPQH